MSDLDPRRLRYFLALAGTLHYGRAAAELHLAQPALSRAIAGLEKDLGVTLFERSRAGTRLTPAGEVLKEEAQEILRSAEVLKLRLAAVEREELRLTIGFLPGTIVTPVVRHLERHFPRLRVDVVRTSWADQITGLREGHFDASLAHRPFDDEGLTVVDLYSERRQAVFPGTHSLAGKEEVHLADLTGDTLLQPRAAVPEWLGPIATLPEGTTPPTVEEKFEQVAAGRGVVVIPASAGQYYRRPDLSIVPVADLPAVQACLVVEARRRSPVLDELVRSVRSIADAGSAPAENQRVLDASPRRNGG